MKSALTRLESLIDLVIEGINDPGILKAVFLAGGPGSGKSKVSNEIFGLSKNVNTSFAGLKLVNSDNIFELALKKAGVSPSELANISDSDPERFEELTGDHESSVRSKAKRLTDKMQSNYENGRLGLIIDGTGKNAAKIKAQKEKLESLGYDCVMVFVDTSLEVSQQRNRMRSRKLPDDMVEDLWNQVQKSAVVLRQVFNPYFFELDNSKSGDNLRPELKNAIAKFVKLPTKNPIGKRWIASKGQG